MVLRPGGCSALPEAAASAQEPFLEGRTTPLEAKVKNCRGLYCQTVFLIKNKLQLKKFTMQKNL